MGIFFVVLIACVCVFCACFFQGCEKKPAPTVKTSTTVTTVESVKSMSRAEIEAMLQKIDKQKDPKPIVSATCYVPRPPIILKKAEYVCPACGQKTIYTTPQNIRCVTDNIEASRRDFPILQKVSRLKMELDESRFCKRCHPVTTPPELVLKITYSDGTVHESEISAWDLRLLEAFFSGDREYEEGVEYNISTLRRILGFEKPDMGKKQ